MERETIEERQTTSPLLVRERPVMHANGGGGTSESGGSATAVLVISTFVAVCGSYAFGAAVSNCY